MRIGLCSSCSGWTLNPTSEKCAYCHNRVAPLKPLAITEVPDGSRISVQGDVYGPDGTKLVSIRQYEDQETAAYLRNLLRQWDEGEETDYGLSHRLFRRQIDQLFELYKPGEKFITISGGTFARVERRIVRAITIRIEESNFGSIEITRVE